MKVRINGKNYTGQAGQTILAVAEENGLAIPTLCFHPDLAVRASCRICVVEVKNQDHLVTACSTLVYEGMDIKTDSPRVQKAREINLELLFAEHLEKCGDCTQKFSCELLDLARHYQVNVNRFLDRKGKRATYRFANAVEIDGTQCIDCQNCVEACTKQGINYLQVSGHGANQEIKPVKDSKVACIYCGQCTTVCPVAAAQEQSTWPAVEKALRDKNKIVVAQFAPAVRVALGEEFGLPSGTNCEGQIYTALQKLGFNYVFDINFGADITTMSEAEELLVRLNDKKAVLPMMTSCCPAWVAYAEVYQPDLLANLTTARSPHIHSAGAIKSYWASENKMAAKNIVVVSIVPCTAKKYEATRPELKYNGRNLVDHVLTTRELAFLIKKNKLNFVKLAKGQSSPLFNSGSGAAAIYGASGGVMESALRTAADLAASDQPQRAPGQPINSSPQKFLEYQAVRGLAGFKEATVTVGGRRLKVGVVNGIANFKRLLPKLGKYHYIEVMACPGGCLGGGGQPQPTTEAIRAKRLAGLYSIDKQRSVRRAHDNSAMLTYYHWVKKNKLSSKLLYTKFS